MKQTKWIGLIGLSALTLIFSVSCATMFTKGGSDYRQADRAYQQKEYVTAMVEVLAALEKNPELEEALALYPRIYEDGSSYYLSIAQQQNDNNDPAIADAAYVAWQYLVELNRVVAESGRTDIETTDYTAEMEDAWDQMLAAHYDNGVQLLAEGSISKAREAYGEFQFVLEREADYEDAEALSAQAVEAGTSHIAVDAGRPGTDGVAEIYHGALLHKLANNRFIDVSPVEAYAGSNMASPLDAMMSDLSAGNLDFVISVQPTVSTETIRESSSDGVPVTVQKPISDDGYFFTQGYRATYSMRFVVKGAGMKTIDEGALVEDTTKEESITVYKAMGELHQDITLDDTSGAQNLIVVETREGVTYEDIADVVAELRRTTDEIRGQVPNAAQLDQMGWKDYFLQNYATLAELKAKFDNVYFSDSSYVFDGTSNLYYNIFGSTVPEALDISDQSSAMYQGISRASGELAERAAENVLDFHRSMAAELADFVATRF